MDRLGIDFISVFGLPPVEFVELVADLGCRHIGFGLAPMLPCNPHGYPNWSLREDAALRRETAAALRDRGVSLSLVDGFFVMPGHDVSAFAADLDLLLELGAKRINSLSLEPDQARAFDQLGALAELAGARGLQTTLEFLPVAPVGDLPTAVAAVRHVGRPDFKVLIDAMHLVRSGSSAADLAALDSGMIGYAQLCDVPLVNPDWNRADPATYGSYGDEASYERMVPGTGGLPLLDILKALPRDIVIGMEAPQLSLAEAGVGPRERLAPWVAAARDLLAKVDA